MAIDQLPQLDRTATSFRTDVDALFTGQLNSVIEQMNALGALMSAAAAGGAYALPYIFDNVTTDADPGAGKLRLSSSTQSSATTMRLDVTAGGQDYTTLIDTFDASTSTIKGTIRLVKQGDFGKWMTFDVTARAAPSGYRNLAVVCTDSSSSSPFAKDDPLLLFFQRTGDKGATGPIATFPFLKVSDRKAAGTSGGGVSTDYTYNDRTLNTIDVNTIDGATLASNIVSLPAGTYDVIGRAPCYAGNSHSLGLYNVTDAAMLLLGPNARAETNTQTDATVYGQFTIASTKQFKLQHYIENAGSGIISRLGLTHNRTGKLDVYAELMIRKIA